MITLVCAACGEKKQADFPPPQLGIDLIPAAEFVGYKAMYDSRYGRMVIFCSDKCIIANRNKDGTLRKYCRPPKGE